jgi:hypothetical protein
MKEKQAHALYNAILKKIIEPMVGNKSTFLIDLDRTGAQLFGVRFAGVFPSDKIPRLNAIKKYAILNLDKTGMPGSHWVAVAHDNSTKQTVIYDSFGRSSSTIIPALHSSGNGRIISTDDDSEQHIKEENCGARSLAWLFFFDRYGKRNALKI